MDRARRRRIVADVFAAPHRLSHHAVPAHPIPAARSSRAGDDRPLRRRGNELLVPAQRQRAGPHRAARSRSTLRGRPAGRRDSLGRQHGRRTLRGDPCLFRRPDGRGPQHLGCRWTGAAGRRQPFLLRAGDKTGNARLRSWLTFASRDGEPSSHQSMALERLWGKKSSSARAVSCGRVSGKK